MRSVDDHRAGVAFPASQFNEFYERPRNAEVEQDASTWTHKPIADVEDERKGRHV